MDGLRGKKVFFIGDSIMAQDGKVYAYDDIMYNTEYRGTMCKGYPTLLKERLGIEIYKNTAIGGHTVKLQREIVTNEDVSEADVFVIAVGVNDFTWDTPIGKLPDSKDTEYKETFTGEFVRLLDDIYSRNPTAKTVLMTPLQKDTTKRYGNYRKNDMFFVNSAGHRLRDYAEAIVKIGKEYSCVVADMYGESGFNRFNLPLFTFEGTHPTNAGYEYVLPVLIDALNRI